MKDIRRQVLAQTGRAEVATAPTSVEAGRLSAHGGASH
jgi:hypothetical protein